MVQKIIFFTSFLLVGTFLTVLISDWTYNLSFGSVNRVSNFLVVGAIVFSSLVSLILLGKSFRDYLKSKLGSRIRLRIIFLFIIASAISSIILSSIFISIIDALKTINESREGERISEISRRLLTEISVFYKDIFNRLDISLRERRSFMNTKVLRISIAEKSDDNVVNAIVEDLKKSSPQTGKSVVVIDDKEYAFVFSRDGDYYIISYEEVDKEIYSLKRGLSKILQISSNSEFLFYDIFRNYFFIILLLLNIPSLFVSVLVAYLFAEYITIGISNLIEGMNKISEGNLEYKVSDRWAFDEIKDLIKEFNKMSLRLLEAQYRVSKIEKMELWKDIARKVAHEIKNPLTPIKLSIQRILANQDVDDFKDRVVASLLIILEEVDRIDNLITQLSNFAKIPQPAPVAFRFVSLIENVKSLFSNQGVEIEYVIEGDDNIYADFDQLKQCLINLIKNGIEASEGISNKITVKFLREADRFIISVRDYGVGIPDDMKDKILKPYITTKKSGSGLGLSIVETIVINHNGRLYFNSELGKGTEFFIEIKT
ncbi:MAG: HAMP domain-containing histidine kinase [Brevinematales bacterium]|nr:HAMP domain-containing histidine kinase [Brevinematales bacterium]